MHESMRPPPYLKREGLALDVINERSVEDFSDQTEGMYRLKTVRINHRMSVVEKMFILLLIIW